MHLSYIRKGLKHQSKGLGLYSGHKEEQLQIPEQQNNRVEEAQFIGPCRAPTVQHNYCFRQLPYIIWQLMILLE